MTWAQPKDPNLARTLVEGPCCTDAFLQTHKAPDPARLGMDFAMCFAATSQHSAYEWGGTLQISEGVPGTASTASQVNHT